MTRTAGQNKKVHAIFSAYARAFPGVSAVEWKAALCSLFPAFLAEAEGRPLPAPEPPESTSSMDVGRCDELIEFCLWLGAEIGVVFREDD